MYEYMYAIKTGHLHAKGIVPILALPKAPSGRVCREAAVDGEDGGWCLACMGEELAGRLAFLGMELAELPATCWPMEEVSEPMYKEQVLLTHCI